MIATEVRVRKNEVKARHPTAVENAAVEQRMVRRIYNKKRRQETYEEEHITV